MKNTGTLRIQAFAARQSSPVEGVTVTVSGNGFTATRLTDAEGNVVDEWVSGEEPHEIVLDEGSYTCLLYTSPSPRDCS